MKFPLLFAFALLAAPISAQFALEYDGTAPVSKNGNPLQMAWAGG